MFKRFVIVTMFAFSSIAALAADLRIEDTVVGSGAEAVDGKTVVVHYAGRLESGKEFDRSAENKPFRFTLGEGRVIAGWEQGLRGMRVGGERRLVIPPELAYGEQGAGGVIPPNATLTFDVKLIAVEDAPWKKVGVDGIEGLIADGAILVDIRRPEEWKETGIVKGAKTLTAFNAEGRLDQRFPKLFQMLGAGDKPIILMCRTGNRSNVLAEFLSTRAGIANIYDASGGIVAWQKSNRPLVDPDTQECRAGC